MTTAKTDFREEITNKIISLIENGEANGGLSLWDAASRFGMPLNYKTRRPYSGVNVLLLWASAVERGVECNEWLTFKQAQELGATVKKGAKGVMGVFFSVVSKKGDALGEDGKADTYAMMKPFFVFNVADIEGLPALETVTTVFEPVDEAERFIEASGAKFTWVGTRAFYHPSSDEIYMPSRERFAVPANAYAVALHELTHWTGHKSRLEREFSGKFGDDAYAFEELVAELGSAFAVAHLGLKGAQIENHASYVNSWLKVLKSDKGAIFSASRHANAAFQFLLEKAHGALQSDAENS